MRVCVCVSERRKKKDFPPFCWITIDKTMSPRNSKWDDIVQDVSSDESDDGGEPTMEQYHRRVQRIASLAHHVLGFDDEVMTRARMPRGMNSAQLENWRKGLRASTDVATNAADSSQEKKADTETRQKDIPASSKEHAPPNEHKDAVVEKTG